jgi:hypothetical protein
MRAAELLEGRVLDGGWRVLERVQTPGERSPGYFSVGYFVENDEGAKGFLKALDYAGALASGGDRAEILRLLTSAYVYERNLLRLCAERGLSRVVRIIGEGSIQVRGSDPAT